MRKTLASLAVLGVLAPASIAMTAESAPAASSGGGSSVHPVSHSATASPAAARAARGGLTLKQYWTPERMKAAKSLDTIAVKGIPQKTTKAPAPMRGGSPITVDSAPGSVAPTRESMRGGNFSRPYSSFLERTNAKVFFSQDGLDYVCSGTVVNSPTKNMVNTAGHCVGEFGTWSENMVVVPAYSSKCDGCGNAPYGIWQGKTWSTTDSWLYDGNFLEDYGYIVVRKHHRQKIVNAIGGRGMVWGLDYDQTFKAMGYPQAPPFDGFNQAKRTGETLWLDGDGTFPYAMAMYSGLTGGSSGGAWDVNYSGEPRVNGHNDYVYTSEPDYMYSPYYGDDEYNLYTYTEGLG